MAALSVNPDDKSLSSFKYTQSDLMDNYLKSLPAPPGPVYVNPAGIRVPAATNMAAGTNMERTGPDQFYRLLIGSGGKAGGQTVLTLNRFDLNPGLYGATYLVANVPSVTLGAPIDNLYIENGYSLIDTIQIGIGDQMQVISYTGDEMEAMYADFNTLEESNIVRSESLHLGITDVSTFQPLDGSPGSGTGSLSVSQNPYRNDTGRQLRLRIPVPWNSPQLWGIQTAGDMWTITGEQVGVKLSLEVKLQDYNTIVMKAGAAQPTSFPQIDWYLEMQFMPRSMAMMMDIWKRQTLLRPLAASMYTEIVNPPPINLQPGVVKYKASVPLSDILGYTKAIGIIAREYSEMTMHDVTAGGTVIGTGRNMMTTYYPLDSVEFQISNEPALIFDQPRVFNRMSGYWRTGEVTEMANSNAFLIALGQDYDMHNETGGVELANKNAKLTLYFTNLTSTPKSIYVKLFLFKQAVYGPTGEWENTGQAVEFVNKNRGDFEFFRN